MSQAAKYIFFCTVLCHSMLSERILKGYFLTTTQLSKATDRMCSKKKLQLLSEKMLPCP